MTLYNITTMQQLAYYAIPTYATIPVTLLVPIQYQQVTTIKEVETEPNLVRFDSLSELSIEEQTHVTNTLKSITRLFEFHYLSNWNCGITKTLMANAYINRQKRCFFISLDFVMKNKNHPDVVEDAIFMTISKILNNN
jgi:hypothetical protein